MKIIKENRNEEDKWHVVSYDIVRHKELSDGAKVLWIILWNWNKRKETNYPYIAKILGKSPRQIMRDMGELREHNYVTKTGDRNDTIYTVKFVTTN